MKFIKRLFWIIIPHFHIADNNYICKLCGKDYWKDKNMGDWA